MLAITVGLGVFWSFLNPDGVQAFFNWAIAIVVGGTVIVVFVAFFKHKNETRDNFYTRTQNRDYSQAQYQLGQVKKKYGNCRVSGNETDAASLTEWSLQLIKSLEWKRFEELCAAYFKAKGHKVEITNLGADRGVDFYLYGRSGDGSKPLGVVQCKAWNSSRVGVKPIRELLGTMTDIGCPLGVFITTTSYTADAEKFAENKHIRLLDARQMLNLIKSLPKEEQLLLLRQITKGDYRTPSCPNCGTKLILRTASRGKHIGSRFWGCRSYPRCRYTMQARRSTPTSKRSS